ncbi:MAG TPA: heme peroxidase family protein [Thermoanaerobaculia bacterium]|nr:heme peroxidase family protein [Thermoanaerobaculia bacterium]
MFRSLPAAEHEEKALVALGDAMTAAEEESDENELDAEENRGISAGYTYVGQFIDHDITFDPASSLQKQNDPDGLVDFRTPRFDLDSVYGRGPDDQPYLYEPDGKHLLLGDFLMGSASDPDTRDLPRNSADPARALIGDPRNDENVIVSQLQGIFLRFHNRVADLMPGATFAEMQRIVRWHYQWAVLHDFLPTIAGPDMVFSVLPSLENDTSIYEDEPDLRFFHWRNDPFMPIEFSVGAYRFGHSMIRPQYRLSVGLPPRFPIFSATELDLRGFQRFPPNWAIEWELFFHIRSGAPDTGPTRVQPAYKIDTSLVDPLRLLPFITDGFPSLAERNLRRGRTMGLPSGQTIARHMCIEPISEDKLRVGKATEEDSGSNPRLVDICPAFADNAPLWFYILSEAQQQFEDDDTPIRLGPVGGRIVTEVIAGLILGDNHSYLAQQPCWRPMFARNGRFGFAELILAATNRLDPSS